MLTDLYARFTSHGPSLAIATEEEDCTYTQLFERVTFWGDLVARHRVPGGNVVALEGEYGVETVAAFLALVAAGLVVVPMTRDSSRHHDDFHRIASTQWRVVIDRTERPLMMRTARVADHRLYQELRLARHPGLVLFSSGSTGEPKAAVHDLTRLLAKYLVPRRAYRTLVFLLLDHIGGINTLFYALSNGGAVITSARTPAAVCHAIERHRVELLPTSPTFLNLLLLSGEQHRHDLSSLQLVTYGTEPMPPSTLERLRAALPEVRVQQTYGLTELGILRSQSRGSDSLWLKVGGEDFETKVVDGTLRIKARSAMLGYLNADMPIDADGYFDTGDVVEVDGEWIRFLGRKTEIINVGGSKVSPAEVESVLLEMDNVADAAVSGENHALVGQVVIATIRLGREEPRDEFKARMRTFLSGRLPAYKHPVRVRLTTEPLHSARFKRARGLSRAGS